MEIKKNINEAISNTGISSQKKGRFIIQDIEEDNNIIFIPPKKYSIDSKKTIFSYFTYDNYNINSQSQTDCIVINNNNNNNTNPNNDKNNTNSNNKNLNEKRTSIKSINSIEDINNHNNLNNKLFHKEKYDWKLSSKEDYHHDEKINCINIIHIRTYFLSIERDNYVFLDFDLIWKNFYKANKINLHNDLDNRIFSFYKNSLDRFSIKIPTSKITSDRTSIENTDNHLKYIVNINPRKSISNSNLNISSGNISKINSFLMKKDTSKIFIDENDALDNIDKMRFSEKKISLFKKNNRKSFCSFFAWKKIIFNINNERGKKSCKFKSAFSNINNLPLHSDFKSDLEINYGIKENEDSETENKIPLKKLSKRELTELIPATNNTESETNEKKISCNSEINYFNFNHENKSEIDLIGEENNKQAKVILNNKDLDLEGKEYELDVKNILREKVNFGNDDFKLDEVDLKIKFNSHGNETYASKKMELDNVKDINYKTSIKLNSFKEKIKKIKDGFFISNLNFDSDKNLISDNNPFIRKDTNNRYVAQKNNKQDKKAKDSLFEKVLDNINDNYSKDEKLSNQYTNFDELLKSPVGINENFSRRGSMPTYKSLNLNSGIRKKKIFKENNNLNAEPFIHKKKSNEIKNINKDLHFFDLNEEDHLYYSCSSISPPKIKIPKNSDPIDSRNRYYINDLDSNKINKEIENNNINNNFLPTNYTNNRVSIYNFYNVNKKYKNSNNVKLNIIKSIQKSFVEDESQKANYLTPRINSADKKLNCITSTKTEIEKTGFDIFANLKNNKIKNKNEQLEESEEISDSYQNLEVKQEISIEILKEETYKINKNKQADNYICIKCKLME